MYSGPALLSSDTIDESVIGAVELSPARGRIHMDWHVQKCNVRAEQVVRFVCDRAARYGRILLVLVRSLEPAPYRRAATPSPSEAASLG